MQITHDVVYMGNDISENVIYLCYYKTKSLQNVHVCRVVGETHAHDYFEVISFYIWPALIFLASLSKQYIC